MAINSPSRSRFINEQDLGDVAMDLPVELTGIAKKSTACSNYILSSRPLYKVALQTRHFFCLETSGLTSKERFNNKANWPPPQGLSVPLTSVTSFSVTGISNERNQGELHRQYFLSPFLYGYLLKLRFKALHVWKEETVVVFNEVCSQWQKRKFLLFPDITWILIYNKKRTTDSSLILNRKIY